MCLPLKTWEVLARFDFTRNVSGTLGLHPVFVLASPAVMSERFLVNRPWCGSGSPSPDREVVALQPHPVIGLPFLKRQTRLWGTDGFQSSSLKTKSFTSRSMVK